MAETQVRIARAYMGDGNTPPVDGGMFPALELEQKVDDEWSFIGRHVGRPGQSYDELAEEAKILHGVDSKPRKGWRG